MRTGESISIWFFIGISLLVNGLLILSAGLYEWRSASPSSVVLFHLHAGIWWGALLSVIGSLYCLRFYPGRKPKRQ